ncbi:PQQ-binding-like beta-propeller repeat protein [Zavarzinella formosa]|uniref:PQQ-binding-like beta-propeller repeat protein n=1 Tax=Zavarzinella formosa TaxID=360055 RepID=UPI0002E26B7A|nr:PQQ-binding-like beta-propeller repeat protein [Zavarzinella formosa]
MKFLSIMLLLAVCVTARAEDWPQFLGPKGDGHYSGPKLPTEWGTVKNVAWKTPIPGKGWSTPIFSKGKLFLTSAVPVENNDQSLHAICVDAKTGKVDWDFEVFKQPAASSPKIHGKNSHASSTPATDGQTVFVHFGHGGTAALDFAGKVLWTRTGIYEKPVHGNGGSPILVDNALVFSCDGTDKQMVIALDQKTGKTLWETPRNNKATKPFSFTTPQLFEQNGKRLVLSGGSNVLMAVNPADGKEVWRAPYNGYSVIPRPIVGDGLVYISTGYDSPVVHAVKLDATGDATKREFAWSVKKGAPNTPSLLLVGAELYMLSDGGVFTCLDAKTGDVIYSERVKGQYSASMLYADGKIYLTSETGNGTLLAAGKKFNLLGEFDMKEKTFATPIGVDGALYIRTETQLYKFLNPVK